MCRIKTSRRVLVLVCAAFASGGADAQTTWHVDDDNCPGPGSGAEADPYCAIQACIDAAGDGDECVVAPGTYNEMINLLGKAITLRSSEGADVTRIDATGLFDTVVTCDTGEGPDTILNGFTITGGYAYRAGGMHNDGSAPTVIHCTFSGNTAGEGGGGGMYNFRSNPRVTHCTFSENSGIAGGMYNSLDSRPVVTNCAFIGNFGGSGGGMLNYLNGSPTVINCTFSGNSAYDYGGGMYNSTNNLTVTNCTFIGNSAVYSGGGMYNSGAGLTVINCTFRGNSVALGAGGGMTNDGNNGLTVANCILWDNAPNQFSAVATVTYSNVQGGWDGQGNIDADPLFADSKGDNARLLPGSPCIDAADNTAVPADVADLDGDGDTSEQIPLDLNGSPRFADDPATVDTGHPPEAEAIVDMGAYEYIAGDGDRDGDTDLFDYEAFLECVTGPGGGVPPECIVFDMDADGDVDRHDFAVLQIAMTEKE